MPKAAKRKKQRTPAQRARRRVAITATVALVLGVVTVAVLALYVGNRALVAKDSLQAAQGQLTSFKSALGQPGAPSTAQMYIGLQRNTAKAAQQVDDPIWSLFESVPYVGPNLKAFRQTTETLNTLVHDGVGPIAKAANGISIDSLKPHDGGIDIAPLKTLTPAVASADDAITAADTSLGRIDTTDVVSQLTGPIGTLRATLQKAMPLTHELRKVMPVLYPALGGDGTRHYLMIFQNNAEERASGGNPAAMAMLVVHDGRIKLGRQGNSGDFSGKKESWKTSAWDKDFDKLYGDYMTDYVTNITMTPDFPTTAKLARSYWQQVYGGKVDAVISFDPVALSYLMQATGPITLQDGTQLDSTNAVSYLLNGVYFKYTDPALQNAVFASAAQSIFHAVTSGQGSPSKYFAQLTPMMNEQRLKMWSVRSDEEKLLMDSPLGTMLPADNSKGTVLGVYNNDDATSKMSYYMDETVDVQTNSCKADPQYTVTAKVTNTLKTKQVAGLPAYIAAAQPRIAPGGDRQWVQLYGPAGGKLVAAYIDGKKVVWGTNYKYGLNTNPDATGIADRRPAVKATMYDRPVGVVSLNIDAGDSKTVKAVFSGGTDDSKTVSVSHTPKVHEVPVTITAATCS